MGPSLSSGRPSRSRPISPSRGTWPGRWPEGAGWKRHVPSGQKGWKRLPRLTTSGTATPRFAHSSATRKRTAGRARPSSNARETAPTTGPCDEHDALACLLRPTDEEELRRAVALVDRAVATGPKFFPGTEWPQFVKGLAMYRQGRPQEAVPLLEDSAALLPNRAGPRLALAMAQFRSGCTAEARKTLAAAVRAYNWMESQADHPTAWVSHVLRREAEALILPDLPAFLRGEYEPRDNDERLALVGTCQAQGRYHTAARLYAEAFTADPDLADNLTTECRYRSTEEEPFYERVESVNTEARYLAARCAALAGCGLGRDGAGLSRAERAAWRQQARAWLRADLALWGKTLDSGSEQDLGLARRMLTHWQVEPDLAGIRDLKALDEASAEERNDCFALWDEVGAVLRRIAVQERAIVLDPKRADPRRSCQPNCCDRDGSKRRGVAWQTALEGNPLDHNAWFGYAELCLFLGREDEYRRARQDLLARFLVTAQSVLRGTHRPGLPAPVRRQGTSCARPSPSPGAPRRPTHRLTAGTIPGSCSPAAWRNTVRGSLTRPSPRCVADASRLDRPIVGASYSPWRCTRTDSWRKPGRRSRRRSSLTTGGRLRRATTMPGSAIYSVAKPRA